MEKFKHCDEYIDDKTQPLCLRRFLRYHRWPASYEIKAEKIEVKRPKLFAKHEDKVVQVVMASRMGDVGITENLEIKNGYTRRVYVEKLSGFSDDKDKVNENCKTQKEDELRTLEDYVNKHGTTRFKKPKEITEISIPKTEYELLVKIAKAVSQLPFGCHDALPWCRESFPYLNEPMLEWEKTNE